MQVPEVRKPLASICWVKRVESGDLPAAEAGAGE
jgi:hypothetical protein